MVKKASIQKIFKKIGILITLISLSACQSVSSSEVPFEGRYWTNPTSYYGEGYSFDLVDDADLGNKDVFIVNNEMELALLLTLFYDQGVYELYYQETTPLDMDRVFLYTIALSPYEIWWEDYTVTVRDGYEIYSAEFIYDFNDIHETNRIIDEWNHVVNSSYYDKDFKIEMVYRDLLSFVSYDDEAIESINRDEASFTALGALRDHKAVCHGYSLAFMGLLKDLDIPSLVVSSDTDDHAWNMVYNEGEWTYFDATWEDDESFINDEYYHYYGLTKEEIMEDHIFDSSTEDTLSAQDYFDLAYYSFPETQTQ